MKGQQKLYDKVISKPTITAPISNKERRNATLIWRYYYLAEIKRIPFADALKRLEIAFHLSENSILKYIEQNFEILAKIRDTKPPLSEFKDNMPELEFSVTPEEKETYNEKRK